MEPRLWIAVLEAGGDEAAAAGVAKQDFGDEAGPREAEKAAVKGHKVGPVNEHLLPGLAVEEESPGGQEAL